MIFTTNISSLQLKRIINKKQTSHIQLLELLHDYNAYYTLIQKHVLGYICTTLEPTELKDKKFYDKNLQLQLMNMTMYTIATSAGRLLD